VQIRSYHSIIEWRGAQQQICGGKQRPRSQIGWMLYGLDRSEEGWTRKIIFRRPSFDSAVMCYN
jgi:hypothetical protein